MYSMVLMVALSGGTEVPDFGRRRGCHGCFGGCYGGWCGGGWCGCYGGWCGGGYYGGYGCWGGYSYGCYGGGYYGGCQGGYHIHHRRNGNQVEEEMGEDLESRAASRARMIVRLPADATLTINGKPTRSTSAERTFVTPPLQRGKTYVYTLRAEATRDGRTLTATRDVTVRAGKRAEVQLDLREPALTRAD